MTEKNEKPKGAHARVVKDAERAFAKMNAAIEDWIPLHNARRAFEPEQPSAASVIESISEGIADEDAERVREDRS